jgi:hypothetical protein
MDSTAIWEGPLGNTEWSARIEPIGENMHRGVLKIVNTDNKVHYQCEVKVDRLNPSGGNETNIAEWNRVIQKWFRANA